MPVIDKIVNVIPIGSKLETPTGRAEFVVSHIGQKNIILQVGEKEFKIPAKCFEYGPGFLKDEDWVYIGAEHQTNNEETSEEETFDTYLKNFTQGKSVSSYVAPILEKAGIAEIDRNRPARIRLKKEQNEDAHPC